MKNSDRFFGDHQPSDAVASTVLAKNGMSWNHLTEEQQKLRYQVPYVVWANYDIGEETGADTSVNYLAAEVLERAGVPLDEYRSYLLRLKSEYPVISAVRTVKADGSEVRASDEKMRWIFTGNCSIMNCLIMELLIRK